MLVVWLTPVLDNRCCFSTFSRSLVTHDGNRYRYSTNMLRLQFHEIISGDYPNHLVTTKTLLKRLHNGIGKFTMCWIVSLVWDRLTIHWLRLLFPCMCAGVHAPILMGLFSFDHLWALLMLAHIRLDLLDIYSTGWSVLTVLDVHRHPQTLWDTSGHCLIPIDARLNRRVYNHSDIVNDIRVVITSSI